MNKILLHRVLCLQYLLMVLWPVSVYAAQTTFTTSYAMELLPALLATLVLSIMSGLTLVLSDMIDEYLQKPKIDRIWLFILSRLFGSITMGMLAFAVSIRSNFDVATTAVFIILAGFGGTKVLKQLVIKWADKFSTKVVK